MGYVTYFKLKIDVPEGAPESCPQGHARRSEADRFCAACGERFDKTAVPFAKEEVAEYVTVGNLADGYSIKWHDHEADMERFSAAHPGVLFTMDGSGENAGDVWRNYYRDGLIQRWKLPTPDPDPFDPAKLEPVS